VRVLVLRMPLAEEPALDKSHLKKLQGTFLKHFQLVKEETAEGLDNQVISMFVPEGTCKVVIYPFSGEKGLETLEYSL
jgi:hypothetical protein